MLPFIMCKEDGGSHQFTLQPGDQFIFFFQLLQQGLFSVGILKNKNQQDTALNISREEAGSSD